MKRYVLVAIAALVVATSVSEAAQVIPDRSIDERSWALRLPEGFTAPATTACGDYFLVTADAKLTVYRLRPYDSDGRISFSVQPLTVDVDIVMVVIDDSLRDPLVEIVDTTFPKLVTIPLRRADYEAAKACLPAPKLVRQ